MAIGKGKYGIYQTRQPIQVDFGGMANDMVDRISRDNAQKAQRMLKERAAKRQAIRDRLEKVKELQVSDELDAKYKEQAYKIVGQYSEEYTNSQLEAMRLKEKGEYEGLTPEEAQKLVEHQMNVKTIKGAVGSIKQLNETVNTSLQELKKRVGEGGDYHPSLNQDNIKQIEDILLNGNFELLIDEKSKGIRVKFPKKNGKGSEILSPQQFLHKPFGTEDWVRNVDTKALMEESVQFGLDTKEETRRRGDVDEGTYERYSYDIDAAIEDFESKLDNKNTLLVFKSDYDMMGLDDDEAKEAIVETFKNRLLAQANPGKDIFYADDEGGIVKNINDNTKVGQTGEQQVMEVDDGEVVGVSGSLPITYGLSIYNKFVGSAPNIDPRSVMYNTGAEYAIKLGYLDSGEDENLLQYGDEGLGAKLVKGRLNEENPINLQSFKPKGMVTMDMYNGNETVIKTKDTKGNIIEKVLTENSRIDESWVDNATQIKVEDDWVDIDKEQKQGIKDDITSNVPFIVGDPKVKSESGTRGVQMAFPITSVNSSAFNTVDASVENYYSNVLKVWTEQGKIDPRYADEMQVRYDRNAIQNNPTPQNPSPQNPTPGNNPPPLPK